MPRSHFVTRLLSWIVIFAIVLQSLAPAIALAQEPDSGGGTVLLPLIAGGRPAYTATDTVFRTRVTVQTTAQWRDLERMAPVFLARGADWADLLVDDAQLADLARWRYEPKGTDTLEALVTANDGDGRMATSFAPLLTASTQLRAALTSARQSDATAARRADESRVHLRVALNALATEQLDFVLTATSTDTDNDGLNDTLEGYWCTDPARADSDFDGTSDGAEVQRLKDWMANKSYTYPSTGKPFQGWPPQKIGCYDDDQDSVPDAAEMVELGLNANRESTDRDKFDDGQELFGQTYCTGQGGFCSYGPLPRNEDWGVIFAEMPSWVKAPANHPLVAAFPVLEVDVLNSSVQMEIVTEISTEAGKLNQITNSYSTAETEGTSTSVARTKTWNNWQEVSESREESSRSPRYPDRQTNSNFWDNVKRRVINTGKFVVANEIARLACLKINMNGEISGDFKPGGIGVGGVIAGGVSLDDKYTNSFCTGGLNAARNISPEFAHAFPDEQNQMQPSNIQINPINEVSVNNQILVHNSFDTESIVRGLNGIQFTQLQTGEIMAQRLQDISFALRAPRYTTSVGSGKARGGSQAITTEQYKEHTVTNGEAFTTGNNWSTATAVNSAHAADLWFTYKVRNIGTEYAREIANLAFNLYIGDNQGPAITYFVAADIGGAGKLFNFMPQEEHTFSSRRIPISLEQLRAIDLGAPIRIAVEDFSFGIDENYYQDAAGASVLIAIEDGTVDGDEGIDSYLIPTWGSETVLNVLTRYFPPSYQETDDDGLPIAIWTPEHRSDTPSWCQFARRPGDQPGKVLWCKHALSTADWWTIQIDGLGTGTDGYQDAPAVPGAVVLFRFNQDRDRDGSSDRTERRLGTDPNDSRSFPHPELLAGVHNIRNGARVTSTLSLLNTGFYDAYGVEAIMVAPDDSVAIVNNTVGGAGRVPAQKQVIVGSQILLQSPLSTPWTQTNHAVPAAGGYYIGDLDRIYSFTVNCAIAGGCRVGEGNWELGWSDGAGAAGNLNFGAGYASPTFQAVGALGMSLALYSGSVQNGENFTVAANTPLDTFQYTINREPFTEPMVIVSYNDPQGNHRLVVPPQAMHLTAPTDNLQIFAGQMLQGVGAELVTQHPFAVGSNTVQLLVNNPTDKTLLDAHLFLEFIDISGTVVSEIPVQVTLPPGPTYTPVTFSSTGFLPPFDPQQDYIVLAFLTDYQGNILDTAGRPLYSFQADPLPKVAVDNASLTWNFGTVVQGAILKRSLNLANTGYGALATWISPTVGLGLSQGAADQVGAGDFAGNVLTLRTGELPVGTVNRAVTIKTSDPLSPNLTLRVRGVITAPTGDVAGAMLRPLDWPVTVPGPRYQGEWVEFTHALGPEPQSLHPVKVYSQDYTMLYGVGRSATDFSAGTATYDLFGDGRDGAMPGSGNLDYNNGVGAGTVSGNAGATAIAVVDHYGVWRINPGDMVLLYQTRGSGAGNWELNRAISDITGSGSFTLQQPLKHSYVTTGGDERAQILRVPQYSSCSVTGTVTPLAPWRGDWGGIVAVMCNDTLSVLGHVNADGTTSAPSVTVGVNPAGAVGGGFRGGDGIRSYGGIPLVATQGESVIGVGIPARNMNLTGGGGASKTSSTSSGRAGGGGGSHAAAGEDGTTSSTSRAYGGYGATTVLGQSDLRQAFYFGGGGGGGLGNISTSPNYKTYGGSSGGGAVLLFAPEIVVNGRLSANGGGGLFVNSSGNYGYGMGGSGAGGSILLFARNAVLQTGKVEASGGARSIGNSNYGGAGGQGRIFLGYCETYTGTTSPPASTQQLSCHVAEQIEADPYTSARLNLPTYFADSMTFALQYGRKLSFATGSDQVTTLRMPAGMFAAVTVDALISQLPASAVFALDVGADDVVDWGANAADNSTNPSPDLAAAFNAYWLTHGAPITGNLDVPVKVTLSRPGQVLLTNLQVSTAGRKQRAVRLTAGSYSNFTLDFTVGGTGSGARTVALDVGADGSIDWNYSGAPALPITLKTGNLSAAVNAYLAGKSGEVEIPLRFFVAADAPVTLVDYAATRVQSTDLTASSISLGTVERVANSLNAGDIVPVQATLRNAGSQASGPVTAAFFAHAEGWGDWYIGSAFFPDIAPGATVQGDVRWDTTGFSGTVPVKVVVNPYGRVTESSQINNSAVTTATVLGPTGAVLAIAPATATAGQGQRVSVDIVVRTDQPVDGAAAYLDFDRSKLQVAAISPGGALPSVLQNSFDNAAGRLAVAAGALNAQPNANFVLATVTFTATGLTLGTPLTYATVAPRRSDVTFGGASLLDHTEGGSVIVENSAATLRGHVTPPGRPTPPHARWQLPLVVTLSAQEGSPPLATFTPSTDASGYFTVTGIAPGSYWLGVKGANTLRSSQSATLVASDNALELGALAAGDANDDNCVLLVDFSILRGAFGKCQGDASYDGRADFNGDACVTLPDFSLLRMNFGVCGDATARAAADTPATNVATMSVVLDAVTVTVGQPLTLTVRVDPAGQPVDGAAAYLTFDPAVVQVMGVTAGDALPLTLQNEFDNTVGRIAFAAGTLDAAADEVFDLAIVRLQAVSAGSTAFTFERTPPRATEVTALGASVLQEVVDNQLTVESGGEPSQGEHLFLPFIGSD